MIPFVDLKKQYDSIRREVGAGIQGVLDNANFILGEPVAQFEAEFAGFCGTGHCIGVASGTDALHLALRAIEAGDGDEVITAANTFVATVLAISYVGARPVLVDADPATFLMDLERLEAAITPRTKAIIPVHLYGRMLDMERLRTIAKRHNVAVVEDACQAHGARWRGRKAGSLGTLGCFSFYPGKNLGAYGDGGAIVMSDESLYERLKMMRNYGSSRKYHHDFIGYNSRLDSIQAAVLSAKLERLDAWNERRVRNAAMYNERLEGIGDLVLPEIGETGSHVFHLYVIRTKRRDELLAYLGDKGVQCGIHYPVPVYSLGAYSALGFSEKDFPVTEQCAGEILSLPMFAELEEEQIDTVTRRVREFYS